MFFFEFLTKQNDGMVIHGCLFRALVANGVWTALARIIITKLTTDRVSTHFIFFFFFLNTRLKGSAPNPTVAIIITLLTTQKARHSKGYSCQLI